MLTYALDYIRDDVAMYSYMPNDDASKVGHVGLNLRSGQRLLTEVSPYDPRKTFAFHMLAQIEEFRDTGDFKRHGMVAWW